MEIISFEAVGARYFSLSPYCQLQMQFKLYVIPMSRKTPDCEERRVSSCCKRTGYAVLLLDLRKCLHLVTNSGNERSFLIHLWSETLLKRDFTCVGNLKPKISTNIAWKNLLQHQNSFILHFIIKRHKNGNPLLPKTCNIIHGRPTDVE